MTAQQLEKGDKKTIRGWAMYDWANSVYPLVITAAIFPVFYQNVIPAEVHVFGMDFINTEIYSYVISLSFLVVTLISPILSGIADYSGNKKSFMKFFCYLGATSCASLYFFNAAYLEVGMISIFFASIGFWGSLVFYNSFLPEISEPKDHDRVSALGFSLGYFGSSLLLILCLILIKVFLIDVKLCFILVGLWWIGFAQITYARLPNNVHQKQNIPGGIISHGFNELKNVLKEFMGTKRLKRFLISFFIYSMGIQTVMLMAVLFAKSEITDMTDSGLIISVLIIQFVGIAGSYLFSWISKKTGNLIALRISVLFWVGICIIAYFVYHASTFYILAGLVGLVMGGIQSLSRSTYAKFLPETKNHASYFSFFDVLEKIAIVIGTFTWGFLLGATGSMRMSVLALLLFFVLGFVMLLFVPKNEIKQY